jgi:hypothetical protein
VSAWRTSQSGQEALAGGIVSWIKCYPFKLRAEPHRPTRPIRNSQAGVILAASSEAEPEDVRVWLFGGGNVSGVDSSGVRFQSRSAHVSLN